MTPSLFNAGHPAGHPGLSGSTLDVAVATDRQDEEIQLLQVMIRLAACSGRDGDTDSAGATNATPPTHPGLLTQP